MNQAINPEKLFQFLNRLAQCFRHRGHLYLVGGSSLLLLQAKQSTQDVDISFEVEAAHHGEFIRCLRQISREMGVAVEPASPDQFMPLPQGYQQRHEFISQFGQIEIFHFDVYSTALSKIERGDEKDFNDVTMMLTAGIIEWEKLEQYVQEILPHFDTFSLKLDSHAFLVNLDILRQRYTP